MTCVRICCVEGIFHDKRSVDIYQILICSVSKANWDFYCSIDRRKLKINYAFSQNVPHSICHMTYSPYKFGFDYFDIWILHEEWRLEGWDCLCREFDSHSSFSVLSSFRICHSSQESTKWFWFTSYSPVCQIAWYLWVGRWLLSRHTLIPSLHSFSVALMIWVF